MERLIERFLDYVSFDTQSSEEAEGCPSTSKQLVFARHLADSLEEMGLEDVTMDEQGYIYATLPSNLPADVPTVGFIAHYDTSPDCSGADIRPRIVEHYDGGDIVLDEAEGIVTSPRMFPEMLDHVGEDIIVTDGHTLLGADDKAGIAEIVEAMAYLMEHPEIEHGTVRIAFNPDEEIGAGANLFDVEKFGADWAYTMDGSEVGELEYENFNAASANIHVKGLNVHPGYAKGKMRNACLIASQFVEAMPKDDVPERTEGYEGFFHLTGIKATVESATLSYIIRDHDRQRFEERKTLVADLVAVFEERYGKGIVTADIRDQYYNMKQQLEGKEHIISIGEGHPWRHRRCSAVVQGLALPQYLCRRPQLPWPSRVRADTVYAEGHADHSEHLPHCGRIACLLAWHGALTIDDVIQQRGVSACLTHPFAN